MKLLLKFNLILLVLFAISGFIISYVIYGFLRSNAEREVLQQANLMIASAKAVRDYTSSDVGPRLEKTSEYKERFLPETIPFAAVVIAFSKLRQDYPDYTYREAALNPTNREDRATDWEADIIQYFRDHPKQNRYSRDRDTPTGPSMYVALPIVAEPSCLQCHGRPAAAPAALLAKYGQDNGFGWDAGSVIGAQIVSVPASVPLQKARQAFHLLLFYLIATLIATLIVLDTAVYFTVIRPLRLVSDAADRISKGETNLPPLPVKGKDEIGSVTASFNRMQLSLAKAFKMLG
jgi:HAMP domain-containing protein